MVEYDVICGVVGVCVVEIDVGFCIYMNKVYGIMLIGMLLIFVVVWVVGISFVLLSVFCDFVMFQLNIFGWIIMFVFLGMVFLFGVVINCLFVVGVQMFFYVFVFFMGLLFVWIFVVFIGFFIVQVFFVIFIVFVGLLFWGYIIKCDIFGWGFFLIMGVIGILVVFIVNIFFGFGVMSLVILVLGVLIFVGLIVYDMQNIKNIYFVYVYVMDEEWLGKVVIMGVLSFYFDFINMFMFLLQLLGNCE